MKKSQLKKIVKIVNELADFWLSNYSDKTLFCDIHEDGFWHLSTKGETLESTTSCHIFYSRKEQEIINFIKEIKNELSACKDYEIFNVDIVSKGRTINIWNSKRNILYFISTMENGNRLGSYEIDGKGALIHKDW